ncbi:MAG: hypothetical protein IPP90_07450 [Gemmatimonadaceae bacterium]|nr:hypothetical protein [Gemmatimonadaceae bacterium]
MTSMSGLLMTVLYVALSVFRSSRWGERVHVRLKITGVIVVMNLVGVGILFAARRRQRLAAI